MVQFQCDYNEGCHPSILEKMVETNMEQTVGYGMDPHCENARKMIKEACQTPDADVHFLVGGTQTNTTVIASALRPYQGVLCAQTGHINVHETGAIEHSGHKVMPLPTEMGLIKACDIEAAIVGHYNDGSFEHMVQPGMVYISYPTEVGTIYSKTELEDISAVCRKYDVPLFIDGARLGYGLMSPESELTLAELAKLADVFYIGGTKQGALFGEALVINKQSLKKDFRYNIKQGGGMLAKGRLLGIQYETLFAKVGNGDCLYFSLAKHAIDEAMRIKSALKEKGYSFFMDSPTNQQFPIFPVDKYKELCNDFLFDYWCAIDDTHCCARICTSWGTKSENVDKLIAAL